MTTREVIAIGLANRPGRGARPRRVRRRSGDARAARSGGHGDRRRRGRSSPAASAWRPRAARGWQRWQALVARCRASHGFAGVPGRAPRAGPRAQLLRRRRPAGCTACGAAPISSIPTARRSGSRAVLVGTKLDVTVERCGATGGCLPVAKYELGDYGVRVRAGRRRSRWQAGDHRHRRGRARRSATRSRCITLGGDEKRGSVPERVHRRRRRGRGRGPRWRRRRRGDRGGAARRCDARRSVEAGLSGRAGARAGVAVAVSLAVCAAAGAESRPRYGGELEGSLLGAPVTLDPPPRRRTPS